MNNRSVTNQLKESPYIAIVNICVDALSLEQSVEQIMTWAKQNQSRSVCVANVHMLMEAHWHPTFKRTLNSSNLITPDGMPLVWMMRLLGAHAQERVAGMDLFKALCHKAQEQHVGIFCLGSQAPIVAKMHQRLRDEYPGLEIAGMEPLPFRPLTPSEDRQIINQINDSKAGILFISLGCPKQEKWIVQHRHQINATMIGLGGVFPVYAGLQKRAPQRIRNLGLEWAYRLYQEPRRLWHRYATTIPPFIWLATRQLVGTKLSSVTHSNVINGVSNRSYRTPD
ncbi:MAG: WecB/TagA/CpsF family glycosyltransferase [Thermosynechococcaceae cyanobacterium]